jgi:predicted DNA binding CopG/RHH family protein
MKKLEEERTRLTLRLSESLYNKIWKIHSETRQPINTIIINILEKELGK